jgi:hypothetical protein
LRVNLLVSPIFPRFYHLSSSILTGVGILNTKKAMLSYLAASKFAIRQHRAGD